MGVINKNQKMKYSTLLLIGAVSAARVTIDGIDNQSELVQARDLLKAAGCDANCVDTQTSSITEFDAIKIQALCACPENVMFQNDDLNLEGEEAPKEEEKKEEEPKKDEETPKEGEKKDDGKAEGVNKPLLIGGIVAAIAAVGGGIYCYTSKKDMINDEDHYSPMLEA